LFSLVVVFAAAAVVLVIVASVVISLLTLFSPSLLQRSAAVGGCLLQSKSDLENDYPRDDSAILDDTADTRQGATYLSGCEFESWRYKLQ
jgi:hypothetical protein